MKIYAASPIDQINFEQQQILCLLASDWLKANYPEADVYFPLKDYLRETGPVQRYAREGKLGQIFWHNVGELMQCDLLVAFHPNLSRGSHFELGFMYAANLYRERGVPIRTVEFPLIESGQKSVMLSHLTVEEQPQ